MKKRIKDFAALFFVILCITIGSCKVNERVQPKLNANMASIPVLKTYLSKMLLVAEDEISYSEPSHEFTIRKTVVMKEEQVQNTYRIANEYKLRNGIGVNKIN